MVILFDLDGTLSDSRQGIVGCTRHALERMGVRAPSDEELAGYIGPPLRSMFGTLLPGGAGAEGAEARAIEDAVRLYRERYDRVGLYEACLYDGALAMLEDAARRASRLFVATAKPRDFAVRVVEHLGIASFFAGVYGPGMDGRLDLKEELVRHLLEEEGVEPAEAVMVGDRGVDVLAARANGLSGIGALWGYGSREELERAGAAALCGAPGALRACLADIGAHADEGVDAATGAGGPVSTLPWRPRTP